ncbi:MAG: cytochrome c peroxidase [Betaproteobacteria bacterium]
MACPLEAAADRWTPAEIALISSLRLNQLPPIPADPSNAYEKNPAAVALGKRLFFDPRFSRNAAVSCATCHDPNQHFQDGKPLAQGVGTATRRTIPLIGAGYAAWLFWDGRKDSLWAQALGPIEDVAEHGSSRTRVAQLMQQNYHAEYASLFGKMPPLPPGNLDASPLGPAASVNAWNALEITRQQDISRVFANTGKAIAAYEKTLRFGESKFDRHAQSLLDRALSPVFNENEENGLRIFIGKGRCVTCHAGPLFTDHHFHSTRVPERDPAAPDPGRAAAVHKVLQDPFNCLGAFSDAKRAQCQELEFIVTSDPGILRAFKTPGLRNVAVRPPYMHAGQLASLREVIAHYMKAPDAALGPDGMVHRLGINSELLPVLLSAREIDDLIAFLGTLSGPAGELAGPQAK